MDLCKHIIRIAVVITITLAFTDCKKKVAGTGDIIMGDDSRHVSHDHASIVITSPVNGAVIETQDPHVEVVGTCQSVEGMNYISGARINNLGTVPFSVENNTCYRVTGSFTSVPTVLIEGSNTLQVTGRALEYNPSTDRLEIREVTASVTVQYAPNGQPPPPPPLGVAHVVRNANPLAAINSTVLSAISSHNMAIDAVLEVPVVNLELQAASTGAPLTRIKYTPNHFNVRSTYRQTNEPTAVFDPNIFVYEYPTLLFGMVNTAWWMGKMVDSIRSLGYHTTNPWNYYVDAHCQDMANAYFDGNGVCLGHLFNSQGRSLYQGAGPASAHDADVSMHELGHGTLAASTNVGGSFAYGSLNEGQADAFAYWISGNTPIGAYFFRILGANPRNPNNTRTLPCTTEIHDCGNVWSGAMYTISQTLGSLPTMRIWLEAMTRLRSTDSWVQFGQAMIAADQTLNGGANNATISNALRARGIIPFNFAGDPPPDPPAHVTFTDSAQQLETALDYIHRAHHFVPALGGDGNKCGVIVPKGDQDLNIVASELPSGSRLVYQRSATFSDHHVGSIKAPFSDFAIVCSPARSSIPFWTGSSAKGTLEL